MIDKEEFFKFFIKIRPSELEEKPYYRLKNENTRFTLFDPIKKSESEASINLDFNKIFLEEANSYIYEEICRGTVDDMFNRINSTFIGYGVTHSGKKEVLFGSEEVQSDITARGCYFRFLETIKNKDWFTQSDISVKISKIMVHNNKFLDLVALSQNNLKYLTQPDIEAALFDKKASQDVEQQTKQREFRKLEEEVSNDNLLFTTMKRIENDNDCLFYSRSHFIYTVRLFQDSQPLGTASFVLLAGSEKMTKSFVSPKMSTTRDQIFIQSTFSALLNWISSLQNKKSNFNLDDSPVTYCLKNTTSRQTKFRFVGSVFPSTGYYDNVKDTLLYLFKCKKTIFEEIKMTENKSKKEAEIEELVYKYENKLKDYDKRVKKLGRDNEELREKLRKKDNVHGKEFDLLKKAFDFEGNIKKLLEKEDNSPEFEAAREIRDCKHAVYALKKKMVEASAVLEERNFEIKKLQLAKKTLEQDTNMVSMLEKVKEKNLMEEKRLKIQMDTNKKIVELENENSRLKRLVSGLRDSLKKNEDVVLGLPAILKGNIDKIRDESKIKETIDKQVKEEYGRMMQVYRENNRKELLNTKDDYKQFKNHKESQIDALLKEKTELVDKHETVRQQYKKELVKLFQMSVKITGAFRGSIKGFNRETFKSTFTKVNHNLAERLSKETFPMLFDAVEKSARLSETMNSLKNGRVEYNLSKTTDFKPEESEHDQFLSVSEGDFDVLEERGMKERFDYEYKDLRGKEAEDLIVIIENLQESIREMKTQFRAIKERLANKGFKNLNFKIPLDKTVEEEGKDTEGLRRRITDLQKKTVSDKITIESQKRMINQLQNEKAAFLMRPKTGRTTEFKAKTSRGKFN